jgi:hypothetical protein
MRMLRHSGGVADAQPPATGFYPCQDTDSYPAVAPTIGYLKASALSCFDFG